MAKKKEPILELTPKGLFCTLLKFDEKLVCDFMDGLELYMRLKGKRKTNARMDYHALR